MIAPSLLERISVEPSGCWRWTGQITREGYGRVWFGTRTWYVHRLTYTQGVGPIPAGLELDHLCRNRWCCNPEHLEAVTRSQNLRRSPLVGRTNASPTHCPHGHEFTPENTRLVPYTRVDGSRGASRACRACRRTSTIGASA